MPLRPLVAALALCLALPALADQPAHTPTPSELLAKSKPSEWRRPDPQNLLQMQLPSGRVLIELAPDYAPQHAANIRTLVREHYFDGLAIIRVRGTETAAGMGSPNGGSHKAMRKASQPPMIRPSTSSGSPWSRRGTRTLPFTLPSPPRPDRRRARDARSCPSAGARPGAWRYKP